MTITRMTLAALLATTAISSAMAADIDGNMPVKALPVPAPPPFFLVNDTSFSYYYAPTATDPGVNTTPKNVLEVTHFDVWKYGTNFFDIQGLQSNNRDPVSPCVTGQGCLGAVEVYALARSTIGFNEVFNTKAFSFGPLKGVSFEWGGDANTENNPFSPEKKDVVAGLQFAFMLPWNGFLNIAPMAYQEWNREGLFPILGPNGSYPAGLGNSVKFKTTWDVEWVYSMPLGFLPTYLPLKVNGFGALHGPKGLDGFGAETKSELYSENHLTLDAGKAFANRPNWLDLWVGYRYWYNKFGADHTIVPYAIESTWLFGITWHAINDVPPPAPSPYPVKAAPAPLPFFIVNDNALTYYYAFHATDPGVNTTPKSVVEYTHFDIWKYGTNFLDIQYLQSVGSSDPASPCVSGQCLGAAEVYALFRSTFGFNEIFGTKAFSIGPLTNISLEFGADANTENNAFAPEKKDAVAGLQFAFMLPWKGFLNIAPMAYKEINHEGLFPISTAAPYPAGFGNNANFNWTYDIEWAFAMPLGFLPQWMPLKVNGFGAYHGSKGLDGFGAQTKPELYSEEHLTLDVGKLVGNKANLLDLWAGYRYWYNKFGADHTVVPFAIESTALAGITWHAF
jgi:hypothetical protein